MTTRTKVNNTIHGETKHGANGKLSMQKNLRQKNNEDLETSSTSTIENTKNVNRRISFKIKQSLPPRRLENRMYITTISASRVQELTSKFNQLCSTIDEQKLPKKYNTKIIKTTNLINKEPMTAKTIEHVKKKPSIKRKPSFIRITPSKNISETIKLFEQNVPSTVNKLQKAKQTILITSTIEKLKSNTTTSQFHKPLKHIDSLKTRNSTIKKAQDHLDGKKIELGKKKVKLKSSTDSSLENICTENEKNNVNEQESQEQKTQSTTIVEEKPNITTIVTEKIQNTLPVKEDNEIKLTNNIIKIQSIDEIESKEEETPIIITKKPIAPNTSFLWRKPAEVYDKLMLSVPESDENIDSISIVSSSESYVQKYEKMIAKTDALITKYKSELYSKHVNDNSSTHSYDNYEFVERINANNTAGDSDSSYEEVGLNTSRLEEEDASNLYEQIGSETETIINETKSIPPSVPPRVDVEILANVIKRNSLTNNNNVTNNKEDKTDPSNYYESICGGNTSRCNSTISHDQQSNSLYGRWEGGKAESDISYSDKSDDWVDVSDSSKTDYYNEESSTFIIIHERPIQKKAEKTWSDKVRCHNQKSSSKSIISKGDDESDHLYESLSSNEHESDFEEIVDSFDSDSEFEGGTHIEQNHTGDKFDSCQLPPTPEANVYSLSRLANRAGKHMQKLKKNWFLTKNDLTKSLGRITRKKTQTEIKINPPEISEPKLESSSVFYENAISLSNQTAAQSTLDNDKLESSPQAKLRKSSVSNRSTSDSKIMHRNSALATPDHTSAEKPTKKRQWSTKFKRSLSLSGEILATSAHQSPRHSLTPEKPQSTFYLYNIQIDKEPKTEEGNITNEKPSSVPALPIKSNSASPIIDSNKKSSWYTDNEIYLENKIKPAKSPSACWYAEINLYPNSPQPNNNSTRTENSADSSDSFSSSTTPTLKDENDSVSSYGKYYNSLNREHLRIAEDPNENGEKIHPQFLQDEPLYQFYTAEKVESGMRILRSSWNEDDDSDGYEQVGEISNQKQSRPSAMQLIRPSSPGQNRTLWCEVPQVISSNILNSLTLQQKKLQEAKFELITSEASYLISLNVLCNHFKDTIHREHLLPDEDHFTLFGNIEPVKKCSENLLADLENCWQDNILLHGICDILRQHANDHFSVYITYCENQVNLEQAFKKLREQNGQFVDVLNKLESSPICQSLPLHSFLMLPMQRITRLPLLVDAILKRLTSDDDEYESCQSALAAVSKVVQQCNEAARNVEQRTEFKRIWNKLDFPSKQPSANFEQNKLIRSGEVTQLISRGDDAKLTFGKKFIKIPLHLFLFTNLFIVAKRKGSEDLYNVIHYCPRNFVEIQTNEVLQLTTKDTTGKHLLFLTILENQDKKTIEMLLSCGTATDKQRWYEAFIPPISQNPDEILYESWDCPQVIVLHKYIPQQPDELPLDTGDIVNVTTKMTDGWYLGERIRDGRSGWFPGNHVTEVASPHVRAKNLKQRYRLLALSQNFLESQKKK
ncbi:MATH and LRR domain-containing protein PFE0570w [Chrysoperla carnea]|uniref:MATH and LRR domain-containing protein PFE0570w n=1 Tax=Chrysoperla carnea TaxID=189513 RepID=UPI001D08DC97|nr:MATH and LRR domain-containing protein PFE0570w [Chrysoperla carnea]XP_044732191.1 MATH and LRR domain-containing protein PFE0570w [Chrysoperla carnea]XP_044732192.1 MATH and LRR domain-containing protein PFE0570w [Chrysoperla carnea]